MKQAISDLERAARATERFGKRYFPTSLAGKKSFNEYDLDRYVKLACRFIAEDIRKLEKRSSKRAKR